MSKDRSSPWLKPEAYATGGSASTNEKVLRDDYEKAVYAVKNSWDDVEYYRGHYSNGELLKELSDDVIAEDNRMLNAACEREVYAIRGNPDDVEYYRKNYINGVAIESNSDDGSKNITEHKINNSYEAEVFAQTNSWEAVQDYREISARGLAKMEECNSEEEFERMLFAIGNDQSAVDNYRKAKAKAGF
jgi:hypothetical protein